jgi:hypothetical protein
MRSAAPDDDGLFFSHVEELVTYTLRDEEGVSLPHLVVPVLLQEVTEDVAGGTIKDLICFLVTPVEAAELPRKQFGNAERQPLRAEILADELPLVHKDFCRYCRFKDPAGFHNSLPCLAGWKTRLLRRFATSLL